MEDLQYPIGKYIEQPFSDKQRREWLLDIEALPKMLEYSITNLDEAQLNTAYRPGGWKVKQVIHHVADSHMNAYIRFKLGLTEDNPVIKPYEEKQWAEMIDSEVVPVNMSITLLFSLHSRWLEVLKNISGEQWNRTVYHPEQKKEITLWNLLGSYAWHGRHHVAHVMELRKREGWR